MPENIVKHYCFTINNYTDTDFIQLKMMEKKCQYLLYGKEICPTTGTPHLQGYVQFLSKQRFTSVSKMIPRANLRVCKGSDDHNYNYCTKDDEKYYEYGTRLTIKQGARSDLSTFFESVKNGATDEELFEQDIAKYSLYGRAIDRVRNNIIYKKRREPPTTVVIWGDSETGKTRSVYDLFDVDDIYEPYYNGNKYWWDGYSQQQTVLFNEYKGQMPINELLKLLDRYPYRVEFKGGSCEFNSPNIYFTSNYDPDEWYDLIDQQKKALSRRINEIIHKVSIN